MELKFYICRTCGNLLYSVEDKNVPVCCGNPMELLTANTVDAAIEKHVPVVKRDGDKVTVSVGKVAHPMTPEHYIQWIAIGCENGMQLRKLTPESAPEATFLVPAGIEVTAYAYCNLHGLWKA